MSSPGRRTRFALWNPLAVVLFALVWSQWFPSVRFVLAYGGATAVGTAWRIGLGLLLLALLLVARERVRLTPEGIRRGLTVGPTSLVPWAGLAVCRVERIERPGLLRRVAAWGARPIDRLVYARDVDGQLVGRSVRIPGDRVAEVREWCDAFAAPETPHGADPEGSAPR